MAVDPKSLAGAQAGVQELIRRILFVLGALLVSRHVGTVAYGGAGMGRVHFGLAGAKAVTDLAVTWPDGKVTQVPSLKAGQNVLVKYP